MVLQESLWFSICCYTLLAPYAIGITNQLFIQEGPWEITLLKPSFGLDYLNPIPHCLLEFII
jgi:hypothetical protein